MSFAEPGVRVQERRGDVDRPFIAEFTISATRTKAIANRSAISDSRSTRARPRPEYGDGDDDVDVQVPLRAQDVDESLERVDEAVQERRSTPERAQ